MGLLEAAGFPPHRRQPRHCKSDQQAQTDFKAELGQKSQRLQQRYPLVRVEVWSFDEHRLGLKPILRKVWAPIGQRPTAVVAHRYE